MNRRASIRFVKRGIGIVVLIGVSALFGKALEDARTSGLHFSTGIS